MNFDKLYKPGLLALALLMFVVVGLSQRQLNGVRSELKLTRLEPLENAPPALAFVTVALGGFRGLIANVLWMRASDLQQDEKFFEMVQLADWITKLQPHFVTVWVHQAWNMAYNISVKFPESKDRWLWVSRGIELLRDEGMRYNPEEPLLYRELAWFYQHKMGANLDQSHVYYKQMLQREMAKVIGPTRDGWRALLNPQTDEARERAKILHDKLKLDLPRMKQVDETFGPLEWRLPESHAIYWASFGLEKCVGNRARTNDIITLRRVIYQSMQLAFQRGRLVENKLDKYFEFGPNLEIIPKANFAYEQMMREDATNREHISNGHRNFVLQVIVALYTHNREADAKKWLEYLVVKYPDFVRQKYPNAVKNGLNLDEFVLPGVAEMLDGGRDKTQSLLEGYLKTAFYKLAIDEDDESIALERMARKIWDRYQLKTVAAEAGRVDLPPYQELKRNVLERILDEKSGGSPLLKAQLRTKLGLPAPTNAPPETVKIPLAPRTTNAPPAATNPPPNAPKK